MKTINVSEAEGAVLDWLVERANSTHWSANGYFVFKRQDGTEYVESRPMWRYSTDWSQAGPIIEREVHNMFKWNQIEPGPEVWCAVHNRRRPDGIYALQMDGPTPLIAAMRCYVASKLGTSVEVPEELA